MSVFYRSIDSDIGFISEPLLNLLPTFVNEEPFMLGIMDFQGQIAWQRRDILIE